MADPKPQSTTTTDGKLRAINGIQFWQLADRVKDNGFKDAVFGVRDGSGNLHRVRCIGLDRDEDGTMLIVLGDRKLTFTEKKLYGA